MRSRIFAATAALAFAAVQTALVSAAYIDITRPGDTVQRVDGFNQNDGDFGPPPEGETEINAIDDLGQKYLNFLDLSSGFSVTPSGNVLNMPVIGVRLYTGNDLPERDPASFQLSGSDAGLDGPWTFIASGNLDLPEGRNLADVDIPPAGNTDAAFQEVTFLNNDQTFAHYQITFPTLKDAVTANSMQIGEVELLAEVPEPASMLMIALGLLGVAGLRRRR